MGVKSSTVFRANCLLNTLIRQKSDPSAAWGAMPPTSKTEAPVCLAQRTASHKTGKLLGTPGIGMDETPPISGITLEPWRKTAVAPVVHPFT